MSGKELYIKMQECKREDGTYNNDILSLIPLIEKYIEEIEFPIPKKIKNIT